MLPCHVPASIGSRPSIGCAYAGTAIDTSSNTTLTFTGVAIGTASADRYVVVAVSARSVGVTNVTVDGVACTRLADSGGSSTTNLWITNLPIASGTTATVVVTLNAANSLSTRIHTWAVTNMSTGKTSGGGSTGTTALNLTAQAGGCIIAVTSISSASVTPTISASGITLTNDYGANGNNIGVSAYHGAASADLSATLTPSSGSSRSAAVALR